MMDGFDLDSPLVCEGIIGDGCGGGRIFFIESDALWVYDPITEDRMEIFLGLKGVKKISKSGCIIRIFFQDREESFDLSQVR